MSAPDSHSPLCSIIVPIYNGSRFIKECLESVALQREISLLAVELIVCDDSSDDDSYEICEELAQSMHHQLGRFELLRGGEGPLGVGSARNIACRHATSSILVFLDADDVMRPTRLARTLQTFSSPDNRFDVVGGTFDRIPVGSTPRYQHYHERLTTEDLFLHAFRDAPLAFPTVACKTEVWRKVPFVEGRGIPEDLHFLYDAMKNGFELGKLLGPSLTGYRYHENMASLALHRRTLLMVRVAAFENLVLSLPTWREGFAIWGSGRDGKEVYRCLSTRTQAMVTMWADIDVKKIGKRLYDKPVVHFSQVRPPLVCCVALDREEREFERNLLSLNLRKVIDYVHLI